MPWGDWQFYVVTLAALCGVWAAVRSVLPRKRKGGGRKTTLTIEGKKPRG
jgi:hypothetical protein